jgi:hypothetical protein
VAAAEEQVPVRHGMGRGQDPLVAEGRPGREAGVDPAGERLHEHHDHRDQGTHRQGHRRRTGTGGGSGTDPRFATCADAKAAGYGPYVQGRDPEYDWYRDADADGTVCE